MRPFGRISPGHDEIVTPTNARRRRDRDAAVRNNHERDHRCGEDDGQAQGPAAGPDDDEKERLTALGGITALSLTRSAASPRHEAILVVLVAAGASALKYSLPITGAIVVLLAALVISYRQVIEAFPNGGGAYAGTQAHLGTTPSLVAAASLIVDYILNAAVGVSAGVEALTTAYPALYAPGYGYSWRSRADHPGQPVGGGRVGPALDGSDAGVMVFYFAVIVIGLVHGSPVVPLGHDFQATDAFGLI